MSWSSFIVDKAGLLLDENKMEGTLPTAAEHAVPRAD